MAQFCTKCGAPMSDGMQFCTSCGATVAAPPAPPAPVQQAPIVAPSAPAVSLDAVPITPVSPVVAQPPKKGSPVVKIVLIVVGVFILFSLLAAVACGFMIYRAKQKMKQISNQIESSLPSQPGSGGAFPLPANPPDNPGENPSAGGTAVDMGDLSYPGATLGQSGNQSIFGAAGIKVQEYFTSDSVDAVATYYKSKLGSNAMLTQNGGTAVIQMTGGGGLTTISIAPDGTSGRTKITVSSIRRS
jgi:hypothetical protein